MILGCAAGSNKCWEMFCLVCEKILSSLRPINSLSTFLAFKRWMAIKGKRKVIFPLAVGCRRNEKEDQCSGGRQRTVRSRSGTKSRSNQYDVCRYNSLRFLGWSWYYWIKRKRSSTASLEEKKTRNRGEMYIRDEGGNCVYRLLLIEQKKAGEGCCLCSWTQLIDTWYPPSFFSLLFLSFFFLLSLLQLLMAHFHSM